MSLSSKTLLRILFFLQFYIWGSWLITIGNYWFQTKKWGALDFGATFSTIGIASIISPLIAGYIADRFLGAKRTYLFLHVFGAFFLFLLPQADNSILFFWIMLLAMLFYMPTIALSNSLAFATLSENKTDITSQFPSIRIWGTIGFILAMWTTNLSGHKSDEFQFYLSACTQIILVAFTYLFVNISTSVGRSEEKSVNAFSKINLKSIVNKQLLVFLVFSILLGAALQLTNMYGDTFINDFRGDSRYKESVLLNYSTIFLSLSQISETIFISTIPFFLRKFGIKLVMLMSILSWFIRFGFFIFANPGEGAWMILLSCIFYGMAFDFFNVSGSIYVESLLPKSFRASAQGLFMLATNGVGAILGSTISGWLIGSFFTTEDGIRDWPSIWLCFTIYAGTVAILFVFLFKQDNKSLFLAQDN